MAGEAVAVVGAGLAGLSCARALAAGGWRAVVWEKSRGVGGRVATRRADTPAGPVAFDHGAQFMTARDPGFRALVDGWVTGGLAARWEAAGADAFVGVPTMNAPLRALAEGVEVRREHTVNGIVRDGDGWMVRLAEGEEERFGAVVSAVPAEQAVALLRDAAPEFAAVAVAVRSAPCWTLMAVFEAPVAAPDVVKWTGMVDWAARVGARPGREGTLEAWVVHADADWSAGRIEQEREAMVSVLLDGFARAVDGTLPDAVWAAAHRWRYARSGRGGREFLWDAENRIGACGDWMIGPWVEAAFVSGTALGRRIGSWNKQDPRDGDVSPA